MSLAILALIAAGGTARLCLDLAGTARSSGDSSETGRAAAPFMSPRLASYWQQVDSTTVPDPQSMPGYTAAPEVQRWGAEALHVIEETFRVPGKQNYIEQVGAASEPASPAFVWSASVQLSALAAAARLEPEGYRARLADYAGSLRIYWLTRGGLSGFATLPQGASVDRYYDDNAWMTLALLDTFSVLGDPQYETWAEQTFRFVRSGEDTQLGGGIFWRESDRATKNTCSTAPAIVAALRLYLLSGDREYLETARRLYAWINSRLQDGDGLFVDNIRLGGTVDRTKYSYNSALMIDANLEFFQVTGQQDYLVQAERIAQAAERRWVNAQTGAIHDDAPFARLLVESFLSLAAKDHDPRWRAAAEQAIGYVHTQSSGSGGVYTRRWSDAEAPASGARRLIDAASAARAYWVAAGYLTE